MKKILVIVFMSLLFICTILSFLLVRNMETKKNEIEEKIKNIRIINNKEELYNKENNELKDSLKQTESFKLDELSIWKKSEEKLSNALK